MVETKNQAESLMHATEKSLEDLGDKLSADEKGDVEKAMADLKEVLEQEEPSKADLDEKTEALTQASMKLGEIAYRQAQEEAAGTEGEQADAAAGGEQPSAESSDDDIVDADFTEVDDDQKSA